MTNYLTHNDIFKVMEKLAPSSLAYDWDNVGLQIGNKNDQTKNVLITLDVVERVVDEAIENGANLIIAHHPLLFKSLKSVDLNSPKGKVIKKLIKHDITVFAAHTNLDIVENGVNDMLSDVLGISSRKPLIKTYSESLYKLIVFVPEANSERLLKALGDAGAGQIGLYSHCGFVSEGMGTFKPLKGANPHVGSIEEQHYEHEKKIEVIVPDSNLQKVIQEMINNHPYEEVAYDLIKLENKGESYGLGRIGTIDKAKPLKSICKDLKEKFNLTHVRVTGDINKEVKRIAVLGGSGEKYVNAALNAKADVYITGDMTFHMAQDAEEAGLTIIDAGHIIEKVMIHKLQEMLATELSEITILASNINTDPFQYY